jgi:iron(III) transport system ATP-binding protein
VTDARTNFGAADPSPAQGAANQGAAGSQQTRPRPEYALPQRISPAVAASSDSHLEIHDATKSFGSTQVLRGVNLTVAKGGTTAIVGPSGSGKTTLLRLIAGFEAPDSGSILLSGAAVADGGSWVPAHRRQVGYVAQDGALFPHLTVGQNVAFGLGLRGRGARARVAELLEMVSIDPAFARRRPSELSGGQQQRVALARALAREPQLMLLDEPFSALDAGLRSATRRAVANTLAQAGVTTILVTHDQAEALSFADQVAVMRDGQLAQIGNPFVVYTRPADRATAEFLGDAVILEAWMEGSLATCSLGGIPVRRPPAQGRVQLMLRPEQIRIAEDGPIHGVVVETDYFGPETTVRIQLAPVVPDPNKPLDPHQPKGGEIITIRHWNAMLARPGNELSLRVVGEGVAFPFA